MNPGAYPEPGAISGAKPLNSATPAPGSAPAPARVNTPQPCQGFAEDTLQNRKCLQNLLAWPVVFLGLAPYCAEQKMTVPASVIRPYTYSRILVFPIIIW